MNGRSGIECRSDGEKSATRRTGRPTPTLVPAARNSTEQHRAPAPRLDGLTVLVVDDDGDARDLIGAVLRKNGATVAKAASANEAFAWLGVLTPDVIVSDIRMPDTDGYALIRKLRECGIRPIAETPAIAITGFARNEDAQRAAAAGFQTHIAKPIDATALVSLVADLAN